MTELRIENAQMNEKTAKMELEVQVAPFGEYDGYIRCGEEKARKITQVLDRAAFERIIDAIEGQEILIDADHQSEEGGSTRAYGWARDFRIDDERGLIATFALTDVGEEAIGCREYRFVSPTFQVDEDGKILSLLSIALTNKPNLPVSCVLNRADGNLQGVEGKGTRKMNKLIEILGLEAEATEEQVVEAVKALQKRVEEAEAAALENEANACADENKDKIANREAFVGLYVKNGRETALAFLGAMKAPVQTQVVLNARGAKTPVIQNRSAKEMLASLPPSERGAYYKQHAAEIDG